MILYFLFFIFIFKKKNYVINTGIECFEYSCIECETEEYGNCTKCRKGFKLIDGKCPCADSSCALCRTGFAGYDLCYLCKDGYYNKGNDCFCDIENCEQCSENGCLKCETNYFYNSTTKSCEKNEISINCSDPECKTCFSEEEGACEKCKEGYNNDRGYCYKLNSADSNNKCPDNFFLKDNFCFEKCDGLKCTERDNRFKEEAYKCEINNCLLCEDNILYLYSDCNNSAQCKLEGCLNCVTLDECAICSQGYYNIGGICKKCIDGCSKCSNNHTCDYCFSGYNLNDDGQCELNNIFDFNVDLYIYFKEILYRKYHTNEIHSKSAKNNSNIKLCETRCISCYENTGICKECIKPFILNNNTCTLKCIDDNCVDCFYFGNHEVCNKCKDGYMLSFYRDKCVLKCSDINCLSCSKLEGDEGEFCHECFPGFKYDKSKKICVKSNNLIIFYIILGSFIGLVLIFTLIMFFVYKYRRRNNYLDSNSISRNNRFNNDNIVRIQNIDNSQSSGRNKFKKEELEDEFEIQKRKMSKGYQICQFCQKKPGKFMCDNGCVLCKEHSVLNIVKENDEEKKECISCKKVVKGVTPIQKKCNICLQVKSSVAHFKCKCSLEVCKDCYVKCKMSSPTCPGCRQNI